MVKITVYGLTELYHIHSIKSLGCIAGIIQISKVKPLYTVGLFHCYMLDESICHFRGVRSILLLLFHFFLWKVLLAKIVDPNQMPNYVASDLALHCLPMTLYGFPGKNGLTYGTLATS